MNVITQIRVMKSYGVVYPYRTLRACRATGMPLWAACAFLEQETAGGQNVFGHDPTIFIGAGKVTKAKYLAYKAERKRTGKMQGVGPMQLTYYTFQDQADANGGCWRPYINMLTAFRYIMSLRSKGQTWWTVARTYNGSSSYANEMSRRFTYWQKRLS